VPRGRHFDLLNQKRRHAASFLRKGGGAPPASWRAPFRGSAKSRRSSPPAPHHTSVVGHAVIDRSRLVAGSSINQAQAQQAAGHEATLSTSCSASASSKFPCTSTSPKPSRHSARAHSCSSPNVTVFSSSATCNETERNAARRYDRPRRGTPAPTTSNHQQPHLHPARCARAGGAGTSGGRKAGASVQSFA